MDKDLSEEEFDYDNYDIDDDEEEKLLNDDNSDKKNNDNGDNDDGEVLDIDIGEDLKLMDSLTETSKTDKDSGKREDNNRKERENVRDNKDIDDRPKQIRRLSPSTSRRDSYRSRPGFRKYKSNKSNHSNNNNNNNNRRNYRERCNGNDLSHVKPSSRYDTVKFQDTVDPQIFVNNGRIIEPQQRVLIDLQSLQQTLPNHQNIPNLLTINPLIVPNSNSYNEPPSLFDNYNQIREENFTVPSQPPTRSPLFYTTYIEDTQNYPEQYPEYSTQRYNYQQEYSTRYEPDQLQHYPHNQQCNPNTKSRWDNQNISPRRNLNQNRTKERTPSLLLTPPPPPRIFELEQDEEYLRKIEEQKRARERYMKIKEQKRLEALAAEQRKSEQNGIQNENNNEPPMKIYKPTIQLQQNNLNVGQNNIKKVNRQEAIVKKSQIIINTNNNNIELNQNHVKKDSTKISKVTKQSYIQNNGMILTVNYDDMTLTVKNDLCEKKDEIVQNNHENVFMSERVVIKRKVVSTKTQNTGGKTKPNSQLQMTKKLTPSALSNNFDTNKNIINNNIINNNNDDNISLFLNNRKIVAKNQVPLIKISNLSVNTTKSRLLEIAQGIGEIQKIHHDPKERSATILFKEVASAQAFCQEYHRHKLDMSFIDIDVIKM